MTLNELDVANPLLERPRRAESLPGVPPAQATYEILVVDDDEYLRKLLQMVMQQRGFRVRLAADGREAVEVYRRHRETLNLVLMDVRMPGLDGPQALTSIQRLNPQVRCCFMSGDLGDYTEEKLLGLGAMAVIAKPFQLAEVAQLVWEQAACKT